MRVLLDSHALLWWLADDPTLSAGARYVVSEPGNDVRVSVASIWELGIKVAAGRLEVAVPDVRAAALADGFSELQVTGDHAEAAASLPRHHGDPFDRMLVAQAQLEGCRLVTRDERMSAYDVPLLW